MQHAEFFVHHSPSHFGEPKISSGENGKDSSHSHNHVEMTDDEIRSVQVDVDRRLCKKESAHAAGDKHRDESKSKKGCGIDLYVRPVQAAQPDQCDDRGGYGD